MRKAITLIEILVVVAIIALMLAMIMPLISMIVSKNPITTQSNAIIKSSKEQVYVVAVDNRTSPRTFIVRKSDGTEIHVNKSELEPIQPKVEKE